MPEVFWERSDGGAVGWDCEVSLVYRQRLLIVWGLVNSIVHLVPEDAAGNMEGSPDIGIGPHVEGLRQHVWELLHSDLGSLPGDGSLSEFEVVELERQIGALVR